MPRPHICRRVKCEPDVNVFKPRGIPVDQLEEAQLSVDEFEAVRLADLECLYQENAAEKMNVSRQTFGNIIASAHKKIADCLVNSKALRIEGGVVKVEGPGRGKRAFRRNRRGQNENLHPDRNK